MTRNSGGNESERGIMMTQEEAIRLADEVGFSHNGIFPVSGLRFLPEVRDMCSVDKCHKYDKCWSCPPGCGTLDDSREKANQFSWGILLQMTGEMEDDFDVETIEETGIILKEKLTDFLHRLDPEQKCLAMSAGACTICKECTYPDAPCRFPDRMHSSMEAYGLVVSEVCGLADTPYYYGPKTMTYTCCVLFPEE